jgi:hypothetical protein
MKYIIFLFCSIILPIFSIKEIIPKSKPKPKLCINCKYFITDNRSGRFGKCSLFPQEQGTINFLVNGVNDVNYYSYCSTARSTKDMCGEEGKLYKRKFIKNTSFKKL